MVKNIKTYFFLIMIVVLVVMASTGSVLAAMSAKSIGLGDDFAVVGGQSAINSNPAAIDIYDKGFSLELGLDGQFWNNLFINNDMTQDVKEGLSSIAENNGWLIGTSGSLGSRMSIGPVTVFVDGKENSLFRLSPDITSLIINGNELEGKYDFAGTEGTAAFYADTGVNYSYKFSDETASSISFNGTNLKNLYMGLTFHYLTGGFAKYTGSGGFELGYDENNDFYTSGNDGAVIGYYTDPDQTNLASGYAFDMGVYTDLDDKYSLGFSILNIGGSLSTDQTTKYEYSFTYDEDTEEWNTNEPPEGGEVDTEVTTVKLPLVIKFGGKMKYTEDIDLLANYTITSYSDSIFSKSLVDHKISAAAEFTYLDYLPLRLGMNYSTLQSDFDISTGLGLYLGPVRMDVGVSDLTGLFYRSKGVSGGLNFSLVF